MEQSKDSSTLLLYVILAMLVVVAGGWLFLNSRSLPVTPPPAITVAPAPVALEVPDEVDPRFDLQQNLDMGQMALSSGQLVEPPDGSALYFFLSALEQDAGNTSARAGLRDIASTIAQQATEQLAGEDFLALDGSLRVLGRIDAADPNLLALREQIDIVVAEKQAAVEGAIRRGQWVPAEALLNQLLTVPGTDEAALTLQIEELAAAKLRAEELAATVAAQSAAQAAAAAAVAAAQGTEGSVIDVADDDDAVVEDGNDFSANLGAQARASLQAGRLIAPADNNALSYLRELQRVAPDDPALTAGYDELIAALVRRARTQSAAGQYGQAERSLDAAGAIGRGTAQVVAAREQVLDARIAAESVRVLPVGELVNTRVVRPRYPARALRNEAEGYVLLNFTVLRDGTTSDIETVEVSERYGEQFERAARVAVGQWEFEPRQFLGEIIEQRVEARVSFEIDP